MTATLEGTRTRQRATDPHVNERERRLQASLSIIHRLCPYCTAAAGQLIDPTCPACLGEGSIRLGPAALAIYEADVVAEAIEIALTAPGSIADTIHTLAAAGIIHRTEPLEEPTMTTETPTATPAWVQDWHEENPAASAAGDVPEAAPETIELEAGTATVRTYWQAGELGHHLEIPDTDVQLLTSADLQALAATLQEIATED